MLSRLARRTFSAVDIWVLLKFLHVAAVIAVFSIQIASDLYFQRVTRSGSTEAVAKLGAAIRQRGVVEALIFEIAVVLGLLTAIFGGFNLLAPWLLMSYAIIVIVIVFAVTYAARPIQRDPGGSGGRGCRCHGPGCVGPGPQVRVGSADRSLRAAGLPDGDQASQLTHMCRTELVRPIRLNSARGS